MVVADHGTVGRRPLVRADPEHLPQHPCHRQEVAAARAGCRRTQRQPRGRPVRAGIPTVGGGLPALPAEHPGASQAQLPERDPVGLLVIGGGVAGLEVGIVLAVGQLVAGAQVTRRQPLRPGQPGRCQHRAVAGQQHDLRDGGGARPRSPGHGDRPAPAPVAAGGAAEEVRHHPIRLGHQPQVGAHRSRLGHLDRGRQGQLDGGGADRVRGDRFGRGCGSGFYRGGLHSENCPASGAACPPPPPGRPRRSSPAGDRGGGGLVPARGNQSGWRSDVPPPPRIRAPAQR